MAKLTDGDEWQGTAPRLTLTDLHAFCEQANRQTAHWHSQLWYYVRPASEGMLARVDHLEGLRAEEVRRFIAGDLPPYVGWTDDKLEKRDRLLRWFARQGMALMDA